MSVKVQTILFNPTSSMRIINVSRGKTERVRAGETVVLNYDIYSLLTTMSKRALDHEVKTGRLKVQTRVVSGDTSFTVDAGTEKHSLSNEPIVMPTKPAKSEMPRAEFKEGEREQKVFGDTTAPSTTAGTTDKITEALGVSVVEDETQEVVDRNALGFDVVEPNKAGKKNDNLAPNDAVNVFKKETTEEEEPAVVEDAPTEDTQEEGTTEEAAVESTTESLEGVVNTLYSSKSYNDIHAELVARFPEVSFTKTAIKKCSSFEELKAIYPVIG